MPRRPRSVSVAASRAGASGGRRSARCASARPRTTTSRSPHARAHRGDRDARRYRSASSSATPLLARALALDDPRAGGLARAIRVPPLGERPTREAFHAEFARAAVPCSDAPPPVDAGRVRRSRRRAGRQGRARERVHRAAARSRGDRSARGDRAVLARRRRLPRGRVRVVRRHAMDADPTLGPLIAAGLTPR